jgi:hypothetical protein
VIPSFDTRGCHQHNVCIIIINGVTILFYRMINHGEELNGDVLPKGKKSDQRSIGEVHELQTASLPLSSVLGILVPVLTV